MATTPWMTSDDLIAAVQRKIAFPISQSTFTNDDILAFANEEMFISQVPSVLQYHEEFFVSYEVIPLTTGVNRYPIPDRAVGMRLRDIKWQDNQGNMFDMTRVSPDDKAFFQRNIGANNAVHKFYIEGNDVVLLPAVTADPTGQFVMSFFLRPNQLVTNDQAAICSFFSQDVTINTNPNPGDTFSVQTVQTVNVLPAIGDPPYQSFLPGAFETFATNIVTVTAVTSLTTAITAISTGQNVVTITAPSNYLTPGQTINITGSNSTPTINGQYTVQNVIDANNFTINVVPIVTVAGTSGSITSPDQFLIGATPIITASNLGTILTTLRDPMGNRIIAGASNGSPIATNVLHVQYTNVQYLFLASNPASINVPVVNNSGLRIGVQGIDFQSIPTGVYSVGMLIDFLQTNPGHRIFEWDVPIQNISGNTMYFQAAYLPVPNAFNGIGMSVGDYICPANECIIPNIPPDLHTSLAERTSARILAALGDAAGLQAAQAKINEIDGRQGTILDDRVEGTPQKVTARHSLLRYGKMGVRRRV